MAKDPNLHYRKLISYLQAGRIEATTSHILLPGKDPAAGTVKYCWCHSTGIIRVLASRDSG